MAYKIKQTLKFGNKKKTYEYRAKNKSEVEGILHGSELGIAELKKQYPKKVKNIKLQSKIEKI